MGVRVPGHPFTKWVKRMTLDFRKRSHACLRHTVPIVVTQITQYVKYELTR